MCGNDARLLFAAMIGIEDAIRFKQKDTPYPTQADLSQSLAIVFGEAPACMQTIDGIPGTNGDALRSLQNP